MRQRTFDLTEPQLARLAAEAERSGQGQAEIVRAALEMLFAARTTPYPTPGATSRAVPEALGQHQQGHQPGCARGTYKEGVLAQEQEEAPGSTVSLAVSSGGVEEAKESHHHEKPAKRRPPDRVTSAPADTPPEYAAVLSEWLAYKADRRQAYTAAGVGKVLRYMQSMGVVRAKAAVEFSSGSWYAGLVEPANGSGNGSRASPRSMGGGEDHMDGISKVGSAPWEAPDFYAKGGT